MSELTDTPPPPPPSADRSDAGDLPGDRMGVQPPKPDAALTPEPREPASERAAQTQAPLGHALPGAVEPASVPENPHPDGPAAHTNQRSSDTPQAIAEASPGVPSLSEVGNPQTELDARGGDTRDAEIIPEPRSVAEISDPLPTSSHGTGSDFSAISASPENRDVGGLADQSSAGISAEISAGTQDESGASESGYPGGEVPPESAPNDGGVTVESEHSLSHGSTESELADEDSSSSDAFQGDQHQEYTGLREGSGADRPSGWDAPGIASHPDRPPADSIKLTEDRRVHILEGDDGGGGHRHGTGNPGKTEFPEDWDNEKIAENVMDVARDPDESPVQQDWNDRWRVSGVRDGVGIVAIVEPDGQVWTAWPREGSPGVTKNPKET